MLPSAIKNELRRSQKCSGIILYVRGFYLLTVLTLTIQQWSSSIQACSPASALWCSAGVCPRVLQGSSIMQVNPRQQTVDHKSPLSPSPSVHLWMSLSLSLSGSTTSQGMFQHATNSRIGCMSLLLDQEGEEQKIRKGGGGNPEKIPSMTQPASVS